MQVFLNILLRVSQYLVPILINFVDKHKDEYPGEYVGHIRGGRA